MPSQSKGYRLGDAEALYKNFPKVFRIPSKTIRDNLTAGDTVKLIFDVEIPSKDPAYPFELYREKMWVEVVKKQGAFYEGRLINFPLTYGMKLTKKVYPKLKVRFKASNICDVSTVAI